MATLLWLQGGACSGNTMSFFNAEEPSLCDLVTDFGIEILWHPSLGMALGDALQALLADIVAGRQPLDVLVFEGTVIMGPGGSGRMNMFAGRPMKNWLQDLAGLAQYVVAIGDCACWGGIPATPPNPTDSTGLQFHKTRAGGFLGRSFRSKAGQPVINISGCPAHPDWITQIPIALVTGRAQDVLPIYVVGGLLCLLALVVLVAVPAHVNLDGQPILAQSVALGFGAAVILWGLAWASGGWGNAC